MSDVVLFLFVAFLGECSKDSIPYDMCPEEFDFPAEELIRLDCLAKKSLQITDLCGSTLCLRVSESQMKGGFV